MSRCTQTPTRACVGGSGFSRCRAGWCSHMFGVFARFASAHCISYCCVLAMESSALPVGALKCWAYDIAPAARMAKCGANRMIVGMPIVRSPHFSFKAMLVAAVVGPGLLCAAMAWWSWARVNYDARIDIARTADVLHEHAERLFQADDLVLARVDDRIAGMSWPEVAQHERELHLFLTGLTEQVEEIDAVLLADADGELQAVSRSYPVIARIEPSPTGANVRDRAYFERARQQSGSVIDGPFLGRLTGQPIFIVARRLSSGDGSFRGIAIIIVSPKYLANFWKTLVSAGDTVSLVREDGVVLARYPEVEMRSEGTPPRFSAAAAASIRTADAGEFEATSAIDGIERMAAYRKLRKHPAYVVYAVDRRNVKRDWFPTLAAFGGLAALASAGLLLTALAVVRRAEGEARALDRAEAAAISLRESEQSQRALFRKAPVPMHALDADRRIIDVNDHWLELLAYMREDVIGRPITDFHGRESDRPHSDRSDEHLATGGLRDVPRRYVKRSGEIVDALVSGTVELDSRGAFVRSITVINDVTARRHAEEAARRERQFSELLAESSTDGIVAVDRDFRFTVWNRAMEALSGIARERIVGQSLFEFSPQLIGTRIEAAWRDTLNGGHTSFQNRPFTFVQSSRSGHFDGNFSPISDPGGSIVGGLLLLRDVTERHRGEEQLRQAQKMEAIGQLTGGVAHDFNNLLQVVLGNLDALGRRIGELGDTPTAHDWRQLTDAAVRGAERGAVLTRRLLAFSRQQPLAPKPTDVNKLVVGMSDLLRRSLGEAITVDSATARELWLVSVDASQLESAVLNLAVNARDAMPTGGKLTIETANVFLDEAYAAAHDDVAPGEYVLMAVTDTGVGMAKEVLVKAFDPFFTTKEVGQGTGLGLSQVYGFVKQSGGHAKIYSESGEGTTVKLYLPRLHIEAEVAESRAASASAPRSQAGEIVLLVEDDDDVRAATGEMLRELGYGVVAAEDGAAALRLLEHRPDIHLLFTDVGLPGGMNGSQLADAVRARRPRLPVLFTSGYERNALVHHGRLDPGTDLLVKPFTYAALASKLRQVLEIGGTAS
jgi:PAS domain S-box-containing protein